MNTRTDMAHEALQHCPALSGVEEENESKGRMRISRIRIRTQGAERKLDKPRGSYITLTLPEDGLSSKEVRQEAGRCLAAELSLLMGEVQSVLVVGLGNRHVTPDALGPQTIESLFVTRHVQTHLPDLLPPHTRTVSAFAAGVMGVTGLETAEAVAGIASVLQPDLIVAVDALASSESDHVGTMVQLNDTGISPGAGVGNFRMGLSKRSLGIPVIAVGIPLVLTAESILYSGLVRMGASDLFQRTRDVLDRDFLSMCVTPKDIDAMVKDGAAILSYGLNLALFGEDYEALEGLMR
ncbi:MAG: GPR endopeptidase [Clostridia bacterium]|nr:GPR endopeptidase [Clostridia bacterium]MBR0355946.1 GPR endopeptidase [Clostridia bacterium]